MVNLNMLDTFLSTANLIYASSGPLSKPVSDHLAVTAGINTLHPEFRRNSTLALSGKTYSVVDDEPVSRFDSQVVKGKTVEAFLKASVGMFL